MFQFFHGLFLYIIVMTLGEFELNDVILSKSFTPFDVDIRLLLGALMFLMTIVLMNLTVCHQSSLLITVYRCRSQGGWGKSVRLTFITKGNYPSFFGGYAMRGLI